jgi:hypothetical protein
MAFAALLGTQLAITGTQMPLCNVIVASDVQIKVQVQMTGVEAPAGASSGSGNGKKIFQPGFNCG